MILSAGCLGAKGRGVSLFLERATRKRGNCPILFVFAADTDEESAAKDMETRMKIWFRERALPCCEKGSPEQCVDNAMADFAQVMRKWREKVIRMETPQERRMAAAALFLMENECFYAWSGEMDVRLLNLYFGRVHLKTLTYSSEEPVCGRAQLEPGVGLLLGNGDYFAHLRERTLKDCLAADGIRGQEQLERRLAETVSEAGRRGAKKAAAALAVTEGRPVGLDEILRQTGCGQPTLVGEGAFGRVYRVREGAGGRFLACKVAEDMESRVILRREAALQESLTHPLFARYAGCVEGERATALFMEYVKGRGLDVVRQKGPLTPRRAILVAIQIAEGLQYLHELEDPVIYRDLKPENVRVDFAGRARLLDLGCACRLSDAGNARAGSRGFAAPEQLGESAGSCVRSAIPQGFYSDVHALGRLLEYMLGGRARDDGVDRLIRACTEQDPRKRPQTMGEALRALRTLKG